MKKKVLFAFVLLLSVVALAGCGKKDMAGEYKIVEATEGSTTIKGEELDKYGVDYTLTVKSDGTAVMARGSSKTELKWDNSYFWKSSDKSDKVKYTYKSGKITMTEDGMSMTFAKK